MLFTKPFVWRSKWCMTLVMTTPRWSKSIETKFSLSCSSRYWNQTPLSSLHPLKKKKSCNSNFSCNLLTGQGLPRTRRDFHEKWNKERLEPFPQHPLSTSTFLSPSFSATTSTDSPRKADTFYDCSETHALAGYARAALCLDTAYRVQYVYMYTQKSHAV